MHFHLSQQYALKSTFDNNFKSNIFSIIITYVNSEEISFATILRDSCKIYTGLLLYQNISEKKDQDFEHDPEISNMLIEILSSLEAMCKNVSLVCEKSIHHTFNTLI